MAPKKMTRRQMEDGDDAHFPDNPAVGKKRGGKKAAARGKKKPVGRKTSKR
jgi:hypothetical protein